MSPMAKLFDETHMRCLGHEQFIGHAEASHDRQMIMHVSRHNELQDQMSKCIFGAADTWHKARHVLGCKITLLASITVLHDVCNLVIPLWFHLQQLTLAFHIVMVAVSPGGTRMMGVPLTGLPLCCDELGVRSDLPGQSNMSTQCCMEGFIAVDKHDA